MTPRKRGKGRKARAAKKKQQLRDEQQVELLPELAPEEGEAEADEVAVAAENEKPATASGADEDAEKPATASAASREAGTHGAATVRFDDNGRFLNFMIQIIFPVQEPHPGLGQQNGPIQQPQWFSIGGEGTAVFQRRLRNCQIIWQEILRPPAWHRRARCGAR